MFQFIMIEFILVQMQLDESYPSHLVVPLCLAINNCSNELSAGCTSVEKKQEPAESH